MDVLINKNRYIVADLDDVVDEKMDTRHQTNTEKGKEKSRKVSIEENKDKNGG